MGHELARYTLMIPGPIELEPEVLGEMGRPLYMHYGREFADFYRETVALMRRVMLAERARAVFLVPGPGTAAIEMAIGNVVGDGRTKIVVATNGFFGERLRQIAQAYAPPEAVLTVEAPWGEALAPQRVEDALRRDPEVRAVAVVHCETSTGVLNPLREIAEVCRRHEAVLIVDAVSSLGGVELRFDEWGLGVCAAATQKCLECPPGLAPIAISEDAWALAQAAQRAGRARTGWFLSFRTWDWYAREWASWHPYPTTMPSGLLRALHLSLNKILQEGLEARWARHARVARLFRQGLRNLGFRIAAVDEAAASPTVTAAFVPEGADARALMRFLREELGIAIGGGIADWAPKAIRVGHMGPTASLNRLVPVLVGLEGALRAQGHAIEPGRALRGLDAFAGAQ